MATARTVEQMERMALSLGAQEANPADSPVNVAMAVLGDGDQQTAGRHAVHFGINCSTLTAVERLVDE